MAAPYDIHPSEDLRALFSSMPVPYQGQDPEHASVIFVGLDANYSAQLFEFAVIRGGTDFRKKAVPPLSSSERKMCLVSINSVRSLDHGIQGRLSLNIGLAMRRLLGVKVQRN